MITAQGVTESWNSEEGHGVVVADTGTEVWVHYSHLQGELRSLRPGQRVEIEWEPVVNQDGYQARAVHVRNPG